MKAFVIVGIVLTAIIGVGVVSYVTNYNYGNRAEQEIIATYDGMEGQLAQFGLQVQEAAQVPGMMAEDLQEVTRDAMIGRYGDGGSDAVFSWIQENYPGQVSPDLYTQIQRIIEAGRNEFTNRQDSLIDKRQAYNTNRGYLWKGFWLRTAGYPKINLAEYEIISSGRAQEVFETGVDTPIQLR